MLDECEVIWTKSIHMQNPQTAGGEYGYDSTLTKLG